MTGAPSAFVDKDSIMKRTALRSFIQSMQQNNVVEIVCNTASPGFYSYLFLVPKKLGGWRPVIDLSFLNFFQVIPTLDRCHKIKALIHPFLLSQGGCAHMWQILLCLFAATEKLVPLGWLHTREAQHCISQHWDFNASTRNCGYLFLPWRRKNSNGGCQHTMF